MGYYEPQLLNGPAAQMDVDALLQSGKTIGASMSGTSDREAAAAAIAAKRRQQEFENRRAEASDALAQQQAVRQEDIYQQGIKKEDATNAGIFASTDPTGYTASKIFGEQKGIADSLSKLDPTTRAATEQALRDNYNPQVSGQQWLGSALSNPNADQSKLFAAKKNQYDLNLATIGTPEHNAAIKENKDLKKWELDQSLNNSLKLLDAKQKYDTAGANQKSVPMYIKNPDGTVTSANVDAKNQEAYSKLGYTPGTFSKGLFGEVKSDKPIYTAKDINKSLSTINKVNLFSGDKDSALKDVASTRKDLSAAGLSEKDINNIIGNALELAVSGDTYDSSVLNTTIASGLENYKARQDIKNGVTTIVPPTAAYPISPVILPSGTSNFNNKIPFSGIDSLLSL